MPTWSTGQQGDGPPSSLHGSGLGVDPPRQPAMPEYIKAGKQRARERLARMQETEAEREARRAARRVAEQTHADREHRLELQRQRNKRYRLRQLGVDVGSPE